jgi:hypothetical protein
MVCKSASASPPDSLVFIRDFQFAKGERCIRSSEFR